MERIRTALNQLSTNRFLVCFGNGIEDSFLSPQGNELSIYQAMGKVLKQQGYQRILFSSLENPIEFYDEESRQLSSEFLWALDPERRESSIRSTLEPGPFGSQLITPVLPRVEIKGFALGDTHALRWIEQILLDESTYRTCVIFKQFESYSRHFTDQRTLVSVISNLYKCPTSNPHRVIFLFSSSSLELLRESARVFPVPEIRSIILDPQNNKTGSPICEIKYPGIDELGILLQKRSHFLQQHLSPNSSKRIARILYAENQPLKTWVHRLNSIQILEMDELRKHGWLSSTRSVDHSAWNSLMGLVGLEPIKTRIKEWLDWVEIHERYSIEGKPTFHMIFMGNPGTGKTTVARLIGEIFQDFGILKKGHLVEVKAADLVADYVGGTAIKTNQVIEQALYGVLFIDEAYALAEKERGGFGAEALETLLTRMENDRENMVVILAGYKDPIEHLLRSNPGLSRRFPSENRFIFPDFSTDQLLNILLKMLETKGIRVEPDMIPILSSIIQEMSSLKGGNFGNAGEMRNFSDSLERLCFSRYSKNNLHPPFILHPDDISEEYRSYIQPITPELSGILGELDSLIGLEPVKRWLRKQVARVLFERYRESQVPHKGTKQLLKHMVFTGNPGTGKTTVARMIGKIYQALGLLRKGHLVEVSLPDLVAGYVGQTPAKVMDQVHRALDGVLFIDEAYSLTRMAGHENASFGQEVVDTLVKVMEDYKGQILIILAGYPEEMAHFLRTNPGLSSRFTTPILFPDFDRESMKKLLQHLAHQDQLRLSEEVLEIAVDHLVTTQSMNPSTFGNARQVIALYEQMKDNLAERVMATDHSNDGLILSNQDLSFLPEDLYGSEMTVVVQAIPRNTRNTVPMQSWVLPKKPNSP
ncbi:ATPases of the AAA+ class [Anaerolinea thermolimosa]|uniref:AAA family ATPase n=1 Tax=Anaerolinea thermolimosa TaxID=229919 RepID=UPI000782F277|nr:AAA family ATPase [Anaerolinea thermolimosa]GAP07250.1 ATPases of the AAA+ class [Anaerolinea thermolimosa]